jgi:hypothetical protein
MLKFYIVWYYCRLTCTFESMRQMSKWLGATSSTWRCNSSTIAWWQQGRGCGSIPTRAAECSGPMGGTAHLVGYLCVFALICIAGWWVSAGGAASRKRRWLVGFLTLVIAYNLIFMTDTKHALVLFPFAFAPFMFHPHFPGAAADLADGRRRRVRAFFGGLHQHGDGRRAAGPDLGVDQGFAQRRPVLTRDGRFFPIWCAIRFWARSRKVRIQPGTGSPGALGPALHPAVLRRSPPARLFSAAGTTVVSSVAGSVNADFFVLMGEFGWIGAAAYYLFMAWVAIRLFRKSVALPRRNLVSGVYMALCCCLIFLVMLTRADVDFHGARLGFSVVAADRANLDMRVDDAEAAA